MTADDFLNLAGSLVIGCLVVGILTALSAERTERRKRERR